jgi:hypothetical protein
MPPPADNAVPPRAGPAFVNSEVADMRGSVVHWDGKHGVIRTDDGIEVSFFPVHLEANGYAGRIKVGDRLRFRCEIITTKEYCLDRIRAVALA